MKRNFKYARLDGNTLVYAPNKLIVGTEQMFNAPAEIYKEQGYLPIANTEPPEAEEGFYYSPVYVEQNGSIVQQWELHEIPETDEATETAEKAAAFDILMGVSE